MTLSEYLATSGFTSADVKEILDYRKMFPASPEDNIPEPKTFYVGGKTLKKCVKALLLGYHLILEGGKGVGKNTLVDTLALIFRKPTFDFPFNGNVDTSSIIGTDVLDVDENGKNVVKFRPHHLVNAMTHPTGAWFVGDEINMTKAEVLAVLHMVTDYRKALNIPGAGRIVAHPAFRFIGTMNYGYMGTQELNEAFADRFAVIQVPAMNDADFKKTLCDMYPDLNSDIAYKLVKLFNDLNTKAEMGHITTRAVSIRGIIQTVPLVKSGVNYVDALDMCVVNKAFDNEERTQIRDIIKTLWIGTEDWFGKKKSVPAETTTVSSVDTSAIPEAVKKSTTIKMPEVLTDAVSTIESIRTLHKAILTAKVKMTAEDRKKFKDVLFSKLRVSADDLNAVNNALYEFVAVEKWDIASDSTLKRDHLAMFEVRLDRLITAIKKPAWKEPDKDAEKALTEIESEDAKVESLDDYAEATGVVKNPKEVSL